MDNTVSYIRIERWYEINNKLIDEVYNELIDMLEDKCTIPYHYNKNINFNYKKMYKDLVYFLYESSNSKYKNSANYYSSMITYNEQLENDNDYQ